MTRIEIHKEQNNIFYESHFLPFSQAGNHPSQSNNFTSSDTLTKRAGMRFS